MFESLNIDTSFLNYYRHPTRYKRIIFQAKIDGVNWYDLSDYVKSFKLNNRIELLQTPAIDSAILTVKNENNAFTPTQYNDVFDPANGKINGTVNDGYLNKVWEVKVLVEVDNGTSTIQIPLFWGWKPQEAITEKHKTADIELKDLLWITTQKKPTNPLLYTDYTPDRIINDILVNRVGIDVSYLDLQTLTTTWEVFIADNNKSWWQILQEITRATGGKLTCSPDGKIVFRTRIENFTESNPVLTINENHIKNYSLDTKRQYNYIKIQSQGYSISSAQDWVVDHELQGDERVIKAGTQATFEIEYTSEYIKDPDMVVYISYNYIDTPVAIEEPFSAGQDDGNIRVNEITAYPNKLVLKITNLATSADYTITKIKFKATPIKKTTELNVEKPNQTDQPDAELNITSYYSAEAMLSNVADVIYNETTKTIKFELQMNEFYPDVFAGNLINLNLTPKGISSGVFILEKVEQIIENSKYKTILTLIEWRNIAFSIDDKVITKTTISEAIQKSTKQTQIETLQGQVQTLQTQVDTVDNRTSYIDGNAPATPSNLALATVNENGLSFITASWDANTESDLLGYELAWSYDGINWNYITTADTLAKFEVAGNKTVYVKVRAYDAEGKKSSWSTVKNITSAKDNIPPATPTGLTTTGLFQTIMANWNKNTEEDFSHYVLQYDTKSDFSTAKEIVLNATNAVIKDLTVNTTYYIRLKAVDKSGNESAWTNAVSASTVKIDDENYYDYAAIKNAIINNGKIDTAWISELDAGKITTGELDGTLIKAKTITTDKFVAKPSFSLPKGAIAYWTDSLVDVINGITPDGYDEINLSPTITLTPDNAPPGSIVADLMVADKIYGNHIAAETITADKLNVTELSSITANIGTVTAGIIKGKTGTTKFDLDNDIIDIGNGAIKIGKGVANGNDGIYINAGNLYVNGEIDTKYLKLTDSAIIDLDSYTTIATYSTYIEDKTAYTWHSVEYSTTNLLICETLVTAKGSKTYLKNVPIKLNIYVKVRATSGAYGASVKVYYKLYYDGTLIYTSQTTDWEYMTVIFDDYLDLYSLTTPSVGKTLKLKVYYMTASNADCNVESNLKAPKTLYIVHAI